MPTTTKRKDTQRPGQAEGPRPPWQAIAVSITAIGSAIAWVLTQVPWTSINITINR